MIQYQLKRPEEIQPGDRFLYGGRLRTVTSTRRSLGSGWTALLEDYAPANVVSARFVVAREDADPLRDPMWLGLDGEPYVHR